MFSSQLGIRLILMLGKSIPRPAPYEVMRGLTSAQVTNNDRSSDGFQMTFALTKTKLGEYDLLQGGALAPSTRVIIAVLLGITPKVLIDGIILHHQLTPGNGPGESTLTVTGKDVSVMFDLKEKDEKHENQPDSVIVMKLLKNYPQYGLVPLVTPTTDVPLSLNRIPRQSVETDFQFIQRLARRNGYIFYIEPITFQTNTAYWGPQTRAGLPQPRLTVGEGPSADLASLHLVHDALAPVGTTGSFLEPFTGTILPIPALPSLRIPPLVASPAQPLRTILTRDTANRNPLQAALAALASATNAPDAVTAQGEIDTIRYGNVLRARRLVGIRGPGKSYDGYYYVRSVTHTLTPGNYKQSFQVSREGTGALLPVVVP